MRPALSVWIESPDSGTRTTTRRVGGARDVQLALPDADGLDQHAVEAERVEHVAQLSRVAAASPPSEPRVAIERMKTPGIERDRFHADAIAEQRAAGERRRGVHRDDAHGEPGGAPLAARRVTSVLFPAPGGPVIPMRRACPSFGCSAPSSASQPSR